MKETTLPADFPEDPPPAALRQAQNQAVADSLPPIAWGFAVLYLLFAASHLFLLPPPSQSIMAAVALGTAIILAATGFYSGRHPIPPAWAHPVAAGIALLALINSILHLYLIGEPRLTTNITLLIIGVGIFFLSPRWLTAILVLSLGSWLILAAPNIADPEWIHFAFAQIAAVFISAIAHAVRYRAARSMERLRWQDRLRRQALRQAAQEAEQRAAELEQARDEAESGNRAITAFLNAISHELRTPLTIILGYAEVLHERLQGDDASARGLNNLEQAANRLLESVNDLIDLSRTEAGRMQLNLDSFPVSDLIDAIAPQARQFMTDKRNQFAINRGQNLGSMFSDEMKVRKILLNLLNNAAKFAQNGSVFLNVARIPADSGQPDQIQFQIADTGIGIPDEYMSHLFEAFRQGDETPSRKYDGIGLGLTLSQRYTALLGGQIQLVSAVNLGTVIEVTLPAETAVSAQSEAGNGRVLVNRGDL